MGQHLRNRLLGCSSKNLGTSDGTPRGAGAHQQRYTWQYRRHNQATEMTCVTQIIITIVPVTAPTSRLINLPPRPSYHSHAVVWVWGDFIVNFSRLNPGHFIFACGLVWYSRGKAHVTLKLSLARWVCVYKVGSLDLTSSQMHLDPTTICPWNYFEILLNGQAVYDNGSTMIPCYSGPEVVHVLRPGYGSRPCQYITR